jgi:acyl-CoA hydrolase
VIAEINPNMPWTQGDTLISVDQIDKMVLVETPVIEYVHPPVEDAVSEKIARYVAQIIEDESTLQIGLGRIPNHMLRYLTNRRDLAKDHALYADWFKKKGDIQGAMEQLTKAIDLFKKCGADGWVARTEKALTEIS